MIGVLYSLGSLSFLVLLVMLFVLNSGAQFVRPAVQAIIPGITEKEDLSTASSLFSLSTSVNQVAGYGIGGIIVLALGVAAPLSYHTVFFLFAAVMMVRIARCLRAVAKRVVGPPLSGLTASLLRECILGLRV